MKKKINKSWKSKKLKVSKRRVGGKKEEVEAKKYDGIKSKSVEDLENIVCGSKYFVLQFEPL